MTHPADLVEIFTPGVQVCTWTRSIDPLIAEYLARLNHLESFQNIEMVNGNELPRLSRFPTGHGREALLEDLALLNEIARDLLGCPGTGLRLAQTDRAMCPGWSLPLIPSGMIESGVVGKNL